MADETTFASVPKTIEPRLLGTSMDITVGTAAELDSWPTSPPKGDREMNVGVEPSFSDVLAEMFETPTLPNRRLDAMVGVDSGSPVLVVLCRPAPEVEEASKLVTTAVTLLPMIDPGETTEEGPATVTLFWMIVLDASDPYPGGTPEEGPLG